MPIYHVGDREHVGVRQWNLTAPAPNPLTNLARATLPPRPGYRAVGPGGQLSLTLTANTPGVFATELGPDDHAVCILYRSAAGAFTHASIAHVNVPNPAVNWGAMIQGMAPGGTFFTVITSCWDPATTPVPLVATLQGQVAASLPAGAAVHDWVYDANHPLDEDFISFGVNRDGFAGEYAVMGPDE